MQKNEDMNIFRALKDAYTEGKQEVLREKFHAAFFNQIPDFEKAKRIISKGFKPGLEELELATARDKSIDTVEFLYQSGAPLTIDRNMLFLLRFQTYSSNYDYLTDRLKLLAKYGFDHAKEKHLYQLKEYDVAAVMRDWKPDQSKLLDVIFDDIHFDINLIYGLDNQTFLHHATSELRHELMHYLLSKGADPNIQDKFGNTAMHLYYSNALNAVNCFKAMQTGGATLSQYAINPSIQNNEGKTVGDIISDYHARYHIYLNDTDKSNKAILDWIDELHNTFCPKAELSYFEKVLAEPVEDKPIKRQKI